MTFYERSGRAINGALVWRQSPLFLSLAGSDVPRRLQSGAAVSRLRAAYFNGDDTSCGLADFDAALHLALHDAGLHGFRSAARRRGQATRSG
ncbi:hypothetical protein CO652_31130 [Rhizobium sp. H4]|nr:hypothetical protein CO652_31130 [Rhizobium sp. H4]